MIKVWMIIFIYLVPVHTGVWLGKTKLADKAQGIYTGSVFSTNKDCMDAVKEVSENGKTALCVETYAKLK